MAERRNATGGKPAASQGTATERALTVAKLSDAGKLVCVAHREATTTSLIVADVFGKKHKNVLQAIEGLVADLPQQHRLNFKPVSIDDLYGRKQPAYEITRDGFSLLAMGFTGKKALEFKLKFLDAFNKMERALLNKSNLSWQQERATGKIARRSETDVIQRFVQHASRQGAEKASWYYASITKLTNASLFGVKAASRDLLSPLQLSFLTVAEQIVRQTLENGMFAGLHHRTIYQVARRKVFAFAASLPPQRQISA